MSESTIRTAIHTALDTVSNVGQTHDYERFNLADWSTHLDLFVSTISSSNVIRGWTVACDGITTQRLTFQGFLYTYRFVMRGYFGLDDSAASEKTALGIVENVLKALDSMTVSGIITAFPPQLTVSEHRMLGSVLCHYYEIHQEISEAVGV